MAPLSKRQQLVDNLKKAGITHPDVLRVFSHIARQDFVPESLK
jgi:protein-L-isoaspartate O-methyltransferase